MLKFQKRTAVAALCFLVLGALAGCGKSDQPATANIPGPAANLPAADATGQAPQTPPVDAKHPVVVIETSLGSMTVKLDAEKAPLTVANFLAYVKEGFYDQTIVHQVFQQGIVAGGYADGFVAKKTSRMMIQNESYNGLKNLRGTISMARLPDAPASATSQFFINVVDNPSLDFREATPDGCGYCVFGEVTAGLDVVDKIAAVEVHNTPDFERTPKQTIFVKSVRLGP